MYHSPPNCQTQFQMGLFLLFCIALYLRNSNATNNMTGFSFELVDKDSIYSPFHRENLTNAEKLEELIRSSQARVNWLKVSRLSINNQSHEMALQPIVDHLENRYVVKLHISKDRIPQNLYFDTASDLTWIQCHHCAPCYPQQKPLYWPDASRTYQPLQCNHPYCNAKACRNVGCRFSHSYLDQTYVEGNYATELFDGIDGVIFGCARKTSKNFFGDDGRVRIAGLLAMDASPRSFVMQLARYTQGRFSHCFVPDFAKTISYLRFGSNVIDNPNYPRTQIIRTQYNLYYVQLNDISVNGQHLNFPRGTFDIQADGEGGCIFDSGSTVTAIIPAAYKVVEDAFIYYFSGYGLKPTSRGGKRSQLCYRTRGRFKFFPSLTLHFQGADLQLDQSFNLFYHGSNNEFCLLIMPIADTTIIGVAMQMDLRVVYDLNNWVISFGRERCAYRP